MLQVISDVVFIIKDITYWALILSYKIGQGIVNVLSHTIHFVLKALTSGASVLKILSEDFGVFLGDLWSRLSLVMTGILSVVTAFTTGCHFVWEKIYYFCVNIHYFITHSYDTILNILRSVFSLFGEILLNVKHYLVLFGSGTWFALTIIPNSIYYTSCLLVNFCWTSLEASVTFITDKIQAFVDLVYTFISDIPVESVLALIVFFCAISYTIKHSVPVGRYLRRLCSICASLVGQLFVQLQSILVRMIRQDLDSSDSESESDEEEPAKTFPDDSRYCVVCQERDKCILMLPCKHVCLCIECNSTLRNYNRICPICRARVHKTMKVFI